MEVAGMKIHFLSCAVYNLIKHGSNKGFNKLAFSPIYLLLYLFVNTFCTTFLICSLALSS